MRWKVYILLCYLLSICSLSIQGQVSVSGAITSASGQPVSAANIIVKTGSGSIIAFGFSDDAGAFSISIDAWMDSLSLEVSHIAYNTESAPLVRDQPDYQVTLRDRDTELPDIVVRVDPVVRRGDTLIFDMQSHKRDTDANIEDVLRRLPGIRIEDNGRILYRGLPISRFYIEGLDLLEGRYKIATRNLNMSAVRDIEIIEHHQHKKVLQDLVRPEEAAINLKLKSSIAFTGSSAIGVGAAPLTHLLRSDLFGFGKGYQFNLMGATSSFGGNERGNFENLYRKGSKIDFRLVTINQVLPPLQLAPQSYNESVEHLGGLSFLRRLSERSQIKWHANFTYDRSVIQGREDLLFKTSKDSIRQLSELQATNRTKTVDNTIIYEFNGDKLYLRADNELSVNWQTARGDNRFNAFEYPEMLSYRSISAKSNIEATIRSGERAYTIYTDILYGDKSDELHLDSTTIYTIETLPARYGDVMQQVARQRVSVHTYSSFYARRGNYTRGISLGAKYRSRTLTSDITADDQRSSLGELFQNDNQIMEWQPYINQSHRIESGQDIYKLSMPVRLYSYQVRSGDRGRSRQNYLFFNVFLEYSRRISEQLGLNTSYQFSHDFEDWGMPFYDGYVLRSHRSISRTTFDINRYRRHEITFAIDKNNYNRRLYYRLSTTLSRSRYALISDDTFGSAGSAGAQVRSDNVQRQANLDFTMSGSISSHIDFRLSADTRFGSRSLLSNGERLELRYAMLSSRADLSYFFEHSVLSLKPYWQRQSNNALGGSADWVGLQGAYYIKSTKYGTLRITYDRYLTAVQGKRLWNNLLGAEYKYELPKHKVDLSVTTYNLTNSKSYLTYQQTNNTEQLTALQLRPAQVQLSVRKKW